MDINSLTQQTSSSGQGTTAGQTQIVGSGTGLFGAVPGASFVDLIFAHLATHTTTTTEAGDGTENNELITSQPDYEGHTGTVNLQEIATLPEAAKPTEALTTLDGVLLVTGTDEAAPSNTINEEGSERLITFLESLVAGLPQENRPVILELAPGQIKKVFDKIQIENLDDSSPALIATGLTPEKLTQLLKEIGDGDEQGEGFIIGLIKILPPQADKKAVFLPRGFVIVQPQSAAGEVNTPQAAAEAKAKTQAKLSSLISGDDASGFPLEEGDFEGVLRVLERAQNKTLARGKQNSGLKEAISHIKTVGAGLSTVPGTVPSLSKIFTSFVLDSIYPEGMDFSGAPGQSLNLTGAAQFTSIIGQAPHAGAPHPATQMVASIIAKATTNGESKNITIQLNPPDLGKVRISIDFNNEKGAMKAMLVAEKPETFLMLQRDAQLLERALQEAGLDVDGGGLSFELSQDGSEFDHNHKGSNGNSGSGSNGKNATNAAGEEIDIIETTMDWYADPHTGLMRYSALA